MSAALAPGDLLTVADVMAICQIKRTAAYALCGELGALIPGVGLRVLRSKLQAYLLDPKHERAEAPAPPPAEPPPAPVPRRGRGTRRACRSAGKIVAHGRTGPELRALAGVGRRDRG